MIVFLAIWLCGWSAGEYFALSEIVGGAPWPVTLFLLVWLAGWTIGGIAVAAAIVWQLLGSERIFLIHGGAVVLETSLGSWSRRRILPIGEIVRIDLADQTGGNPFHARGRLAVLTAARTHRVGIGLDADEAQIVKREVERFLARGGAVDTAVARSKV